jgi:hypothetical protein
MTILIVAGITVGYMVFVAVAGVLLSYLVDRWVARDEYRD